MYNNVLRLIFVGVFWEETLKQSESAVWIQLEGRIKEGTSVAWEGHPSAILYAAGAWV